MMQRVSNLISLTLSASNLTSVTASSDSVYTSFLFSTTFRVSILKKITLIELKFVCNNERNCGLSLNRSLHCLNLLPEFPYKSFIFTMFTAILNSRNELGRPVYKQTNCRPNYILDSSLFHDKNLTLMSALARRVLILHLLSPYTASFQVLSVNAFR